MEHGPLGPMTPFDRLTTTQELQMMKLLLPYTPASSQRMLAVFIKFQEMQNTIKFFAKFKQGEKIADFDKEMSSPMDFIEELRPFMGEKERSSMDMMMSAMSMMEMMNSMTSEGSEGGGMDPMEMMKGMMDPEQQEAFEAYNMMFAAELDNQKSTDSEDPDDSPQTEGDEEIERMDE